MTEKLTGAFRRAAPATKAATAPGIVGSAGVILVWLFSLVDVVVPADVGIAMAVVAIFLINRVLSKI